MGEEEVAVTFSLKELLSRLDLKLDSFVVTQHNQDQTLYAHDKRITALERDAAEGKDSFRFKVPLIISVVGTLTSPFLWWGVSHIH